MRAGGGLAVVAAALVVVSTSAATRTVTRAQLALMPLPKVALGSGAAALPLDPDSGVVTNADAAQDANRHATATQLAQVGRLTGYQLDYNDGTGAALQRGRGLLQVQTGVELYSSPGSAKRGLAFWKNDELAVSSLNSSAIHLELTPVSVPGVGADSFAYSGRARIAGKPTLYGVDVYFRNGQLLGHVSVSAADAAEVLPLARKLTPALRSRIGLVEEGRITGPPVPLPGKLKAGPPPNGPPLDRLTLTTSDVGGGVVAHQGYRLDTDLTPISEYERELSPAGTIPFLEEQVALFHSPIEAGFAVAAIGRTLQSPTAAKALGLTAGSAIKAFKPTTVALKVGDESYAVIAQVGIGGGRTLDEGLVVIRIGSTMEFVIAGAARGGITSTTLTGLANAAVRRAATGLRSK